MSAPSESLEQRLVELLEEARRARPITGSPAFTERLDALEIEALERCAPSATLATIRCAREAIEFAARIAAPRTPRP